MMIMGAEVVLGVGCKRCVKGQGYSLVVWQVGLSITCSLFASRIMFHVVTCGN